MKQRRLSSKARYLGTNRSLTLALALLVPFGAEAAETRRGDSVLLGMSNSSTSTQKILVIPIVDKNFNYSAANRRITDANFPGQTGLQAGIEQKYAVMGAFWRQASYEILDIKADVPKCFYRTSSTFPNAGEAAFKTAYLESAPLQFLKPIYGVSYQRLALEYVADPTLGVRKVELMADPSHRFWTAEELVKQMQAQLGEAADDLEIRFDPSSGSSIIGTLVFQIIKTRTFPGSRVSVGAATPDASRINLGLAQPTIRTTNQSPVRAIVTTDGAILPSTFTNDAGAALNFALTARAGTGNNGFFGWKLTHPDGTPLNQNCRPNCPSWTNAADLSKLVRPSTNVFGAIREVMVAGRRELEFEMETASMPGTIFERFETNLAAILSHDATIRFLGLRQRTSQVGTALGRGDVTRDSPTLTREALQAFLNTELADDSACLPWGELPNLSLSDTAAAKAAIDAYLQQYSAIHAFLLTSTNSIRDNASYTYLTTALRKGANNMSYQIAAPVASVEISTDAATIAHEVGHNVGAESGSRGFPDLYDNSNTWSGGPSDYHPDLTYPGNWDVMHQQALFPFPGVFLREAFAKWLSSPNLNHGTVARVTPGQTRTFVLTPVERSQSDYDSVLPSQPHPVAKMIALPLGEHNGSNLPAHFISIENRQPAPNQTDPKLPPFNQKLPSGGGVHVTDNLSVLNIHGSFAKPVSRNFSHTLTPKVSGSFPNEDGSPVTGMLDLSNTFPGYPGVIIEHLGTVPGPNASDPVSAIVRVKYPQAKQVDVSIEPWDESMSATRAIWFERATSKDPPMNPTVPTDVGNVNAPVVIPGYEPAKNGDKPLNWIHVKVDNPGTFDLSQVRLRLSINSPGGMGDPDNWKTLVVTPVGMGVDIPAGGSRVVSFPWSPKEDLVAHGHTCIAAEVMFWDAEGQGQVGDVNPLNNMSQENVYEMNVVSGSPWHDLPFQIQVHNSFNHDVEVALEPSGLPPGYSVTMDSWTAHLPGASVRTFAGTLHWDSTEIPTPPSQDPNDPFWTACTSGGAYPYGPPHCQQVWSLRAFAMMGDFRVPLGSVSFQTQGRPVATVNATTSVGANGSIVVSGTINPPSTAQTVRVVVHHPTGAVDYADVPTTATGTFTTTVPPQGKGPAQVSVELPRGGGPFAPTAIEDMVLGCGFLPDKLEQASCSEGAAEVNLGRVPSGCRAEIVSVDGMTLATPVVLSSGVVTLRPGRYVIHWTATSSTFASKVSPDQTVTVVAREAPLCCAAGQKTIIGDDLANSYSFTDDQGYCVISRGGQDAVYTAARGDSLFGGADGDHLTAGAGTDFVVGGDGSDNISGTGNLEAHGGPGADSISVAQGKASVLWGGAGADQLVGGPESDRIYPGSGANNTAAGAGNDKIVILNECEITAGAFIDGGSGTDTLVSPVSLSQLRAMGVTVVSIETVQVSSKEAHLSDCFPRPPAPPQACGVLPDWQAGTSYAAGARVENGGIVYECKPAPANGWCGQVGYEPGVSAAWPNAWTEIGPCF